MRAGEGCLSEKGDRLVGEGGGEEGRRQRRRGSVVWTAYTHLSIASVPAMSTILGLPTLAANNLG